VRALLRAEASCRGIVLSPQLQLGHEASALSCCSKGRRDRLDSHLRSDWRAPEGLSRQPRSAGRRCNVGAAGAKL
jgi:hypothetical protein